MQVKFDSSTSWIVAITASIVLATATWSARCSSILFVGILERFGCSREEAAWPLTMASVSAWFIGPVVGALSQRFDIRTLLLFASIVNAVAVILSSFAKTIFQLSLTLGLLHGCSAGVALILGAAFVVPYFDKYRSAGVGVLMAGLPILSIGMPSFVQFCFETYQFSGALLLLAGLSMQGIPAALFLFTIEKPETRQPTGSASAPLKVKGDTPCLSMDGNDCATRNSLLNTPKRHKEGFLAFKIFDEKWFYIIALAHMSFLTTLATLMNVMEDFGRDKKLEPVTARNLVAIFAATDIIGRLGSPWITDGGYIAREHLFILDLFLKAVCHSLLGLANNPIVIICLVAWSGWLFGSISILFANILTQKLGARYLPIATGWYLFFAGLLGLTRPRAIGYFREQLGTYSPIIFFLAGFSALAGTVYLVAHLLERKRKISGVEMTLADRDHRPDSGRSRTNSQTANL